MAEKSTRKQRWSLKSAVKQGYLIKFHRGLIKIPKMQYFVLMPTGLTWFNYKPDQDTTSPTGCLPLKQITSIKVDEIELNSCMLSCMEIISRTSIGSNCLLAFSRQEERNEWMMALMTALAEALVSAKTKPRESKPRVNIGESAVAAAVTQIHGIAYSSLGQSQEAQKRRKRNRQTSIRRSKSNNALACDGCQKNEVNAEMNEHSSTVSYEPLSKRKSEPDVYQILGAFRASWPPANVEEHNMKLYRSTCFDHRDSFDLILSRQSSLTKCNDIKSNIITKIISKFEHSKRLMH